MVIQYQPVRDALKTINSEKCYFLSPQGERLSQKKLINISEEKNITFLCGRYEGVDQRVIDNLVDEEISIGDYVLSGGELPAAIIVESVTRLLQGVAEDIDSIHNDSFYNGILDHPHYTKPEVIDDMTVPDILLSGNHKEISILEKEKCIGSNIYKKTRLVKKRETFKRR
jgi:tRNA (guanine37-N1)-methyltransferase